jgi:hypothetical protein
MPILGQPPGSMSEKTLFAHFIVTSLFEENRCSQVSADADIKHMALLAFLQMVRIEQKWQFFDTLFVSFLLYPTKTI